MDLVNRWLQRLGLWLAQTGGWDQARILAPLEDAVIRFKKSLDARHADVADLEARLKDALALMETHRRDGLQAWALTAQAQSKVKTLIEAAQILHSEIAGLKARTALTVNEVSISEDVLFRARMVSEEANTVLSGGEAKRHYVYARLMKDFPATDRRTLALAIELALPPKEG